jgi:Uma2 family endonuclease
MVWLVYPEKEQIAVYTLGADNKPQVKTYNKQDTLDGGDVLPGFSLPLNLIFRD